MRLHGHRPGTRLHGHRPGTHLPSARLRGRLGLGRGSWAVATALGAALGLAATTLNSYAATTSSPVSMAGTATATAAGIEDYGADCAVPGTAVPSNSLLPDPFTRLDGTRVTIKADWRCRRAEIKELAERSLYVR